MLCFAVMYHLLAGRAGAGVNNGGATGEPGSDGEGSRGEGGKTLGSAGKSGIPPDESE